MAFDAVSIGEQRAKFFRAEKSKRRFKYRTDLISCLEDINGKRFHQILQAFGERRFAAADRTEKVENLASLLETLRRMFEIADDTLDRVLHPEEPVERAVDP